MAFKQEVNIPLIVTIGVVSGVLLLVIVIGVQAWYQSEEQAEIAAKTAAAHNTWLDDLKLDQTKNIGKVQKDAKGVIHIPIEDAMRVLEQTGGKIPTTQPVG